MKLNILLYSVIVISPKYGPPIQLFVLAHDEEDVHEKLQQLYCNGYYEQHQYTITCMGKFIM